MKNLKISAKLLLSFLVVTVLSIVLALIGIISSVSINNNYTYLLESPIDRQSYLNEMKYQFTMMRYRTANYAMEVNNPDIITGTLTPQYQSAYAEFSRNLQLYEDSNAKDSRRDAATINENHDNAEKLKSLVESFHAEAEKTRTVALSGDYDEATFTLRSAIPIATEIVNMFDEMITPAADYVREETISMGKAAASRTTLLIIITIVCVIISVCLSLYIAKLISAPVQFMRDILMKIGHKGDLEFSEAEYRQTEQYAETKDEIGESVSMLLATIRRLVQAGKALEQIASKDMTAELIPISERDTMGLSLEKMTESLNEIFSEINTSTAQVSTGSKQIADGSQALAQGSTEQAAAVEQLSSSISEIALKTKDNANMALRAAKLSENVMRNAEKGNAQMQEMMEAVTDINQASVSINKVIKVIDDIAFQTNILALNAAVEAARAGQHGKGFAVVAEEVRNLAAKSSEAAKDTGSLIANSMEKAEIGARIAAETAASLSEIVAGINESAKIVADIARSSEEQSLGIAQINKGIDQVSQVVQQNSATAEQSAAAAEEMSGQSVMLEQLVSQFILKNNPLEKHRSLPSGNTPYNSLKW